MKRDYLALAFLIFLPFGLLLLVSEVSASPFPEIQSQQVQLTPDVATAAELDAAKSEWLKSGHADTYDNGMGANTTCAKCKSPMNWDPQNLAADTSQDCASCKRIPGSPRPDLEGGVPVFEEYWKNISCDVCHRPVGDSYDKGIAFWNQKTGHYVAVDSVKELCGKCHEGQHGFRVIEEQDASPAHQGWECTRCHGAHGSPSKCSDCHNERVGLGAYEHSRHKQINCTACHDAGGLSIWLETNPESPHYEEYVPVRFAHTMTSWSSHNLQLEVSCGRCHHPLFESSPLASETECDVCHEGGAVLYWCTYFPRDPAPIGLEVEEHNGK